MLRTYVVCYLLLISGLGVCGTEDKEKSFWDSPWAWVPAVVGGTVAGAVLGPVAIGAGMYTAATTGVGAGLVAAAQSTGAAMAAAGAATGYSSRGKKPNSERETEK